VGSEGGSFADPTVQVETSGIPLDRIEGHGGPSSVATWAIRSETVAAGGMSAAPDPSTGMLRYPTDSPSAPAAAREASGPNWRAGAIGAAAGFAAAFIAHHAARRR
jgi:hypothetical protein